MLEEELKHNGSILVAPEGTRTPGEVGLFKPRFFKFGVDLERRMGRKIGYLPAGLEYIIPESRKGKTRVNVRFGSVHYYDPKKGIEHLKHECREELRILSNL